jgi:hypothetical protein
MLEVPDLKSGLFLIDSLHWQSIPSTKILPAATTTEPGGTFKAPIGMPSPPDLYLPLNVKFEHQHGAIWSN